MSVAWNGTDANDGGYSAGVSDFNIFYDVRLSLIPALTLPQEPR